MKIFVVEGINRLGASNLLYNAGLKNESDYTLTQDGLTNTYEVSMNEKSSKILCQMKILSS